MIEDSTADSIVGSLVKITLNPSMSRLRIIDSLIRFKLWEVQFELARGQVL